MKWPQKYFPGQFVEIYVGGEQWAPAIVWTVRERDLSVQTRMTGSLVLVTRAAEIRVTSTSDDTWCRKCGGSKHLLLAECTPRQTIAEAGAALRLAYENDDRHSLHLHDAVLKAERDLVLATTRETLELAAKACEVGGCSCAHSPCDHDDARDVCAARIRALAMRIT